MTATKSSRRLFLLSVIVGFLWLADSAFAQPETRILGGAKGRQPGYGEMENFTLLSYTDLDGWDQAAEFRVSKDGRHAYVSNYQGFSIVDVSDPSKPRVISKVKNDPSVQSQYIDVLENILVINQDGVRDEKIKHWEGGLRLYDISDPAKPRELSFFKTDVAPRRGVHGFWLHEDPKQGKFALIATTKEGYHDNILMIVDITIPPIRKKLRAGGFRVSIPPEERSPVKTGSLPTGDFAKAYLRYGSRCTTVTTTLLPFSRLVIRALVP
jgi:hypothetical protein